MNKKVRLWDYKDTPKTITIKDFEKVKTCIFEIKSGDGALTIIYNNGKVVSYDSSANRLISFDDGKWLIEPKDIDAINEMKNHYDTDKLDEVDGLYGTK